MGKIVEEFETEFDKGDVVVFKKKDALMVGIVEGYYIDHNAGSSIWYNIRTSQNNVYSYSNGGDIQECYIYGVLEGDLAETCHKEITNG